VTKESHDIMKAFWTRFRGSEVCEVVQCKYLAISFDSRLPDHCSEMCVCVYTKTPEQKKSPLFIKLTVTKNCGKYINIL